jgi:hypothetical protein
LRLHDNIQWRGADSNGQTLIVEADVARFTLESEPLWSRELLARSCFGPSISGRVTTFGFEPTLLLEHLGEYQSQFPIECLTPETMTTPLLADRQWIVLIAICPVSVNTQDS